MSWVSKTLLMAILWILISDVSNADVNDSLMNAYDVRHYDLSISLDLAHKTLEGNVTVKATVLQPLHEFFLHASRETLTIDSVISQDGRLPFRHDTATVIVSLPITVQTGQPVELTIYYHGISNFHGQYDGGGVFFSSQEHAASISEPNFARTWWPCKDIPSDKATAMIQITVDDHLTAVSNGILIQTDHHDHSNRYVWKTDYPIATYLVSIAVAPYKELSEWYTAESGEKMKITYYIYPEDLDKAKKVFEHTRQILDVFGQEFHAYPFLKEKLAFAEVDGELTMENQTACSIQQNLIVSDNQFEPAIVHETAHQWWGNLVTPVNWRHIWLSEGFATYAEALYREFTYGRDSYDKYIAWLMPASQGQYAGAVVGTNDTAFWDMFSQRVYNKGALVLHMLRGVVGDSLFFTIMRKYLDDGKLRYGNAATEDFIRVSEGVYGKNLRWFFDEWLFTSVDSIDRPEYEYRWKTESRDGSYDVRLDLTQISAARQLFRMPMTITVSTKHGEHEFSISDSLATQSFTFHMNDQPVSVEIDKKNYIFKIVKKKESD